MNQLACPACGHSFRASEVDRTAGVATCGRCAVVMDLRTRAPASEEELERLTRPRPTPKAVPLPPSFHVEELPGRFSVSWTWRSIGTLFLVFFALLWNGFLVLWFTLALLAGAGVMVAFGSLHAVVGLGLAYFAAALLFNSTRVTLEQGLLQVHHGPLPVPGGGSWRREDLAQLYGEEIVRRGKHGVSVSYDLSAMLRDGRRVKLVKGLKDKAQVLWLEAALETRLNIVDTPVAGELAKA